MAELKHIKILTSVEYKGVAIKAGTVTALDQHMADRLINAGYAVEVSDEPKADEPKAKKKGK